MLTQVEIAEREQELIKAIELVRQKMVDSTAKAAQRIIELNDELAELEVYPNNKSFLNLIFALISMASSKILFFLY